MNKLGNININGKDGKIISLPTVKDIIDKGTELYIMIGIPCSGKSTYVKKHFNCSNTIIVSSDQIRKELTGTYKYSMSDNDFVFALAEYNIEQALSKGYNVVFDATNTILNYRRKVLDIGKSFNSHIVALVFRTPASVCLARNSKRTYEIKVPDEIIINMSSFNSNIDKSEGFDEVIFIN